MFHPLLYLFLLHFPLLSAQLSFLPELHLQLMQLLIFFHPLFLSLPLHNSHVALLPLCLYSHNYFPHKWICSELATLLFLHVVDNIPLSIVTRWYVYLCYYFYLWCSPGCCFTLLHQPFHNEANQFIGSREIVEISPWVLLHMMKCPVDPVELYSCTIIFHKAMRVILIVTLEVEWILVHLLCFDIRMLETLYLV